MEFWTAVHVIRRRWYVVVVCAAFFALVAVALAHEIRPSYQTSGGLLVVQTETPPGNSNASNNFGTTGQFANDLGSLAAGDSFATQVAKAGGTGSYTVTPSFSNTSVLLITATASSPEEALTTYHAVTTALDAGIDQLQGTIKLASGTRYGTTDLPAPGRPVILVGSKIKALIVLGVVAVLVTLGLVFGVDSWFNARDRRRSRQATPEASGSPRLSMANGIATLNEFVALSYDDAEPLEMTPGETPTERPLRSIQDDGDVEPGSEAAGS